VFARLTNAQLTKLQSLMIRQSWAAGDVIWASGDVAEFGLLVADGSVKYNARSELKPFGRGAYVGSSKALRTGTAHQETVSAVEDGWGYQIPRDGYLEMLSAYPGVALCLHDTLFLEAIFEAPPSEPAQNAERFGIARLRESGSSPSSSDWDF
jgi:CRP-like cAMP-binding protein